MKRSVLFAFALALLVPSAHAEPVSPRKMAGYRDGGVVIRMSEPMGSVLSPGEKLSFRFQTTQDAFVVVFDIDTDGYVHLLYPTERIEISLARQNYDIPANGDALVVSGETGVEFIFALTIPERSFIDEEELAYFRGLEDRPLAERYRIDGDPFLAANMIAGELVRGITRREGIYFDYTYFYVNARVDYPCYLCGECEGDALNMDCETYRVAADFERESPMRYPLSRAYAMIDPDAVETEVDTYSDGGVDIDFYPYRSEVRYISRLSYGYDPYWSGPGWYDPWYSGWYWYPGSYPGASYGYGWGYWNWGSWCGTGLGIGWGWGWGGGYGHGGYNGYWSSAFYSDPYYGGSIVRPDKFKSRSDDGTLRRGGGALVAGRQNAAARDRTLRIASRNLRADSRQSVSRSRRSATAGMLRSTPAHKTTRVSNSRSATNHRGRTYTRRATRARPAGKGIRGGGRTTTRSGRGIRSNNNHRRRSVGTDHHRATTNRRGSSSKSRATTRSNTRSSSRSRATTSRSSTRGSKSKGTRSRNSSSRGRSKKSGRR